MPVTLSGGCHCRRVRFEVTVPDVTSVRALDCNCSICRMKGFLHLIVTREQFTLVEGGEHLQEYRFHTGVARHLFCRLCGIHAFYVPRSHPDGIDVNVHCLDQNPGFSVEPFDGQNWEANVGSIQG